MYHRRGIHGRAKTQCRLESHLTRGGDGRFVQAMTQAAYYAIHMHLPVRAKQHREQYFSLQPELARFLRINRVRLGDDFYRRGGRATIRLRALGSAVRNFLRSEASSLHRSTVISIVALRDPISEARASDGALHAFGATRSVPGALAFGQIKRSQLGG